LQKEGLARLIICLSKASPPGCEAQDCVTADAEIDARNAAHSFGFNE
jgi:hypothetical protein